VYGSHVDIEGHRKAAIARVVEGAGHASPAARRAAFDGDHANAPAPVRALLEKVARHAYKVTDADVAAVKELMSEDEIFELVVAATLGQAARQLAAATAAISEVG
jgi:hypothetical protein